MGSFFFRGSRAGKIKHALANKLLDLFGEGWSIDPDELCVNRGSNKYNDWCSWTGYIYSPSGVKHQIHSWVSMGNLLKQESIGFVDKIDELGGTEIS